MPRGLSASPDEPLLQALRELREAVECDLGGLTPAPPLEGAGHVGASRNGPAPTEAHGAGHAVRPPSHGKNKPPTDTRKADKPPPTDKPKMDKPKTDKPKMEKPKAEKPKTDKPKDDKPKKAKADKPFWTANSPTAAKPTASVVGKPKSTSLAAVSGKTTAGKNGRDNDALSSSSSSGGDSSSDSSSSDDDAEAPAARAAANSPESSSSSTLSSSEDDAEAAAARDGVKGRGVRAALRETTRVGNDGFDEGELEVRGLLLIVGVFSLFCALRLTKELPTLARSSAVPASGTLVADSAPVADSSGKLRRGPG